MLKIITFAKPGYPQQFQALIQYNEPRSAQTAKENYDGQNLYYGCCPLKVEYSKLTNLNVKYNNEKSRDYTRPDLPTGENTTPVMANPMDQTTLALGKDVLTIHHVKKNFFRSQVVYKNYLTFCFSCSTRTSESVWNKSSRIGLPIFDQPSRLQPAYTYVAVTIKKKFCVLFE